MNLKNIQWSDIQWVAASAIAILGWVVGHYFSARREISSKRRQLATEHLINAYRILTNEISHRELKAEQRLKLENILSDIQLFGSLAQVKLAQDLADAVASGGVFQLDPLTNSLRDELRHQLRLKRVAGNVKWLRFVD